MATSSPFVIVLTPVEEAVLSARARAGRSRALLLDPAAQGHQPGRLRRLNDLATQILAFQGRYNATAEPFDRTYTRDDLNAFLNRLTDHDPRRELGEAA